MQMTCNQNCRQGRDCNCAGWHVVPLTPESVAKHKPEEGRLKFGGSENSAPFPNAVVVFRPTVHDALAEAV